MSGNTQSFADLMAYQRQTEALAAVAERLGWDQETTKPRSNAKTTSQNGPTCMIVTDRMAA